MTTDYKNSPEREVGFFEKVVSSVKNLELNRAFAILDRQISELRVPEEKKRLDRMKETYGLMVRFLTTGAPDPSRADMTASLQRDALAMADRLDFARLVSETTGSYYSTARVLAHRNQALAGLIADYDKAWLLYSVALDSGAYEPDLTNKYEESLQELFRAVMATPPGRFSEEDVKMIVERATDPSSAFALTSQLVSGLLLGLLEHYDRDRLLALLNIYRESADERVQAQALVGIMLGLRYHSLRPEYDRELRLSLQSLADDLTLYPRLRDIFYALLNTQDTKRIQDYMQKNIIPQIQKINPEELKKMTEGALSPDAMENPEWAEKLEKSELGKKLKKLNKMEFEGADMMVMAFANLKMFPFFGSPGNWLLPFDSNHSAVRSVTDESLAPVVEFLEEADMMCDSDKYSFVLGVNAIPSDRRAMMVGGFRQNMETIREQIAAAGKTETRFKREVVRYLRNLYRLFTLSSRHFGTKRGTDTDPVAMLESGFDILGLPYLGDLLCQQDVLEIAAEFQFKRRNYSLAEPLLLELAKFESADLGHIWEKLGYINENKALIPKALDYYRKAELILSDNPWLLRHIGGILSFEREYSEAVGYYKRLYELDETNPSYTALYALALLLSGQPEESLKLLRRLSYEASENEPFNFDGPFRKEFAEEEVSTSDLIGFWISLAEMVSGNYSKALEALPFNLPDSFLPYSILANYLQGNFALVTDGLARLKNTEIRDEALEVLCKYEEASDPYLDPDYLPKFFAYHIDRAGGSLNDFLLLRDNA